MMRKGSERFLAITVFIVMCTVVLFSPKSMAIFVKSCDSFVLLADESSSMNVRSDEVKKIDIEKKVMEKINSAVPNADYQAALRVFSHSKFYDRILGSTLYSPPSAYSRCEMKNAISKVDAGVTWTSIGYGLDMASLDLAKMPGRRTIVLFSDGTETAPYDPAPVVAKELKERFNDLCIYAVQIGDDDTGRETLDAVVKAAGCGRVVTADDLNNKARFGRFIEDVFGKKAKAGVTRVYFNFDKAHVRQKYHDKLDQIAQVMLAHPDLKLEVKGYTDSRGSRSYNKRLSKRRAEQVKSYLMKKGVAASRIVVKPMGESHPIASNATARGRSLNRRAELRFIN